MKCAMWGAQRAILAASVALCIALLLVDYICMMVFMDTVFQTVTDQPSTLAVPTLSIAAVLLAVVTGTSLTANQYALHCVLHCVSGFCCVFTAVKLRDPEPPRWLLRSVWTELLPPVAGGPTQDLHQVVVWLVGAVCLGWAVFCAYTGLHTACREPGEQPESAARVATVGDYLAVPHRVVSWLGVVVIAFVLCYNVFFHDVPPWQRFDTPLALCYLAIFFSWLVPADRIFDVEYAAVAGVLCVIAACTSTAYVLLEIRHVDGSVRWNNHAEYMSMFPTGALASLPFGAVYRYASASGFSAAFASAFARYNTHVHVCRVIAMSCSYGLLLLHVAHPILHFKQAKRPTYTMTIRYHCALPIWAQGSSLGECKKDAATKRKARCLGSKARAVEVTVPAMDFDDAHRLAHEVQEWQDPNEHVPIAVYADDMLYTLGSRPD